MKKGIIFMLMLSLLSVMSVSAQHKGYGDKSPKEKAEMIAEKLQARLDLTDQQKSKVFEVHLNMLNRRMELKKAHDGNREQMREEMMNLKADMDAQMQSILTDSQFELYNEMKEERKAKMQQRREHKKNAPTEKRKAPNQ